MKKEDRSFLIRRATDMAASILSHGHRHDEDLKKNISQNKRIFENTRRKILEAIGRPLARPEKEKNHNYTFVLVHEAGLGAWSWFKLSSLVNSHPQKARAISMDLAASGLDSTHPHQIFSLQQYAKPLIDVLSAIPESQKVVLVAHGLGGLSAAFASEIFASKIAVAVYVAALMFPSGLHALQQHLLQLPTRPKSKTNRIFRPLQSLTPETEAESIGELAWYEACNSRQSSAILPTDMLFNTSPPEDSELAGRLLRAVPNVLAEAHVETSEGRYGGVRRVFVKTKEDRVFPMEAQDEMLRLQRAERVLSLPCDHSPQFSAPHALQHMLFGIARVYLP